MSWAGLQYRFVDKFKAVADAAEKGNFTGLHHAAASIRKSIIESIRVAPGPSPAGTPVHSRKGKFKRSLLYDVNKARHEAVIGLSFRKVGRSGEPHEKGTRYFGVKYPRRPTVLPGLLRAIPRISGEWYGSLG